MITFNDSASNILSTLSNLSQQVSQHLENQGDNETFNVKAFSEKYAANSGHDEQLVATFVRAIVRNSDEYANRRGRNGGVHRTENAIKFRETPQLDLFAA